LLGVLDAFRRDVQVEFFGERERGVHNGRVPGVAPEPVDVRAVDLKVSTGKRLRYERDE
jgi:hypothetical protein